MIGCLVDTSSCSALDKNSRLYLGILKAVLLIEPLREMQPPYMVPDNCHRVGSIELTLIQEFQSNG
jgi:hypothetical protein